MTIDKPKRGPRQFQFGEGLPFPADWKTMPEGKAKYQCYLCSREWAEKREAVLFRSDGICERCRNGRIDVVHHLTYQRKYAELSEDLAGWCEACHAYTHGKSDYDPLVVQRAAMAGPHPFVGKEYSPKGSLVVCPYCFGENCHLSRPTWKDESGDGNQGRITILIQCECGHEFDLVFAGHKGTLIAFTRNARDTYDADELVAMNAEADALGANHD